ncbi:uncharacterized protein J8A68_002249 [[Candida] subhashii]|uniref:Kinesin motor domain-containing protein n=1 Tax=[Candida] subhashii TaxID=561895 RepID=A0A8J5UYD9_9ASCO|nr:uncharacterized protein J8A68_002249 [[Candida] subhashii]KAG7664235.1 hypothetical protein J8A68_002249 [[Candida] subhashii]
MSEESNNIKVTVRVRPLLPRELTKNDNIPEPSCLVSMPTNDPKKLVLEVPKSATPGGNGSGSNSRSTSSTEERKIYYFDECVWSFDKQHPNFTDNKKYYDKTGSELLTHLFEGYNVCLLAYGQTSSGKTYTMMGNKREPGIIPLLMKDILKQMEISVHQRINCELKLSYVEIYNEQVKDLLGNGGSSVKCKVREHPQTGPYVENVLEHRISDYNHFLQLLSKGNHARSTASTSMNDTSSRSHAIITLTLKQTRFESVNGESDLGDAAEEMISNIKLVDLAGSERLSKTKLYGQKDRIKEGTLINKSLTVLGRCINLLATKNPSKPNVLVPYRESALTYILKENLSGNSKTCMIFCVSPIDFEETHQTLNYANEVKKITTTAKANKTRLVNVPVNWQELQKTDKTIIDSLKNEIEVLTSKLNRLESSASANVKVDQEVSKFDKIIEYLESESAKVKFENKYLKSLLVKKNKHIEELDKHMTYIEHSYDSLFTQYKQSQMLNIEKAKEQLLEQTQSNISNIEIDLLEFDPAKFF